jgi:hemoglobin
VSFRFRYFGVADAAKGEPHLVQVRVGNATAALTIGEKATFSRHLSRRQCRMVIGEENDSGMTADRPAGTPIRDAVIDDIVARTAIDEAMIERLVRAFYGRARRDPRIGPVFAARVHDWDVHIAQICAFWSSVALMSGRYHGQPMVIHQPLPIDTPDFDRWLEIFAETAREICPPAAAAHFLERACRIADSLELGIAFHKGEIRPRRPRPVPAVVDTEDRSEHANR